jgi:GxxExxY protein
MKPLEERINRLSYDIIGAALEVHKGLGPGLLESVYEDALCIELGDRRIRFEHQKEVSIAYQGRSIGTGRIDIPVSDLIIVELKAVAELRPVHTAQIMTYLKITGLRLGLLKNGIKRMILCVL